jgi:hypothetical protein
MEDEEFRDVLAKLALGQVSYNHEVETCVISVFNHSRPCQRPTYINGSCIFVFKDSPDAAINPSATEVVDMPDYVDPGASITFRPQSSQCVGKCILSISICTTDSNGPVGPFTAEAVAEPGSCLIYRGFAIGSATQMAIDHIQSIRTIAYELKAL